MQANLEGIQVQPVIKTNGGVVQNQRESHFRETEAEI